MFLKLTDAQKVDPTVTQETIDALEQTVRGITNNHFHVPTTKRHFVKFGLTFANNIIGLPVDGANNPLEGTADALRYIRVGDTLEVYGTGINDGVFEVTAVDDKSVTVRIPSHMGDSFIDGTFDGTLVKIHYPADISAGMLKLIAYDKTMSDKIGIKSETVSRLTVTYFDALGTDTTDGYPSAYMNFLLKYRRIGWD